MISEKNKEKQKAVDAKYYDALIKPVITEKSSSASEYNKVTFQVRRDANKPLVKKAVEAIFGVDVHSVNVMNTKGKQKRFRGIIGVRSDVKKAIVTLKEGQSIDIEAGVN